MQPTKQPTPLASADNVTVLNPRPAVIRRADHPISRAAISASALKVLYRLDKAGYQACLVGGSVRDLLLGQKPKDFDIATDARPEQVRELFRNCRLIGRRFRLAHVRFGSDVIEVATFRAENYDEEHQDRVIENGRILRDNVYGGMDDDVWRRDFTVNALYYNVRDFTVVDYVGGMADVRARRLRMIGDPETRLCEDPVRMLRAVRLSVKLGFEIDAATLRPFEHLAPKLSDIAPARLFDELLKMFLGGAALESFLALRRHGLIRHLFPMTEAAAGEGPAAEEDLLIKAALANTDKRIAEGKPVTPAFLFAALLWQPMCRRFAELTHDGLSRGDAQRLAADAVISAQIARVAIPRRFTAITREIWLMQNRLERRVPRQIRQLLGHERLRAAYDFLLLRAEAGEDIGECAAWWQEFMEAEQSGRDTLLETLGSQPSAGRPRGRRRSRRRG